MSISVFEQIASSLTVKSVCSPLGPDVQAGSTIGDLLNLNSEGGVSRVIKNDHNVVGMLSWGIAWEFDGNEEIRQVILESYSEFDDIFSKHSYYGTMVDDVVLRPQLTEFLSSATTIFKAVDLFAKTGIDRFYVLNNNDLVGILNYSDLLSKPICLLAFFALTLEIETLALELCQLDPKASWDCLSKNRQAEAKEIFEKRHGKEPNSPLELRELINCTQFCDKGTILWKQRLVEVRSRGELQGTFNKLERVRNQCAHPGGAGIDLGRRQSLSNFLAE